MKSVIYFLKVLSLYFIQRSFEQIKGLQRFIHKKYFSFLPFFKDLLPTGSFKNNSPTLKHDITGKKVRDSKMKQVVY